MRRHTGRACLLPELCSAKQIRQVLNASAMELGRPGKDFEYGFGLVQAKAALDRIAATGCGN